MGSHGVGHNRSDLARIYVYGASLVTQKVKNLPATQETRVQSLGWEDPLDMVQSLQFCACIIMCINLRVYLCIYNVYTLTYCLYPHTYVLEEFFPTLLYILLLDFKVIFSL